MKWASPAGWPVLFQHLAARLTVDVILRLQSLHVILQVGFVGIGRRRKCGLHFLHRIIEIALAAINAGHTDVRGPLGWELLRIRAKKSECFFLLLLPL